MDQNVFEQFATNPLAHPPVVSHDMADMADATTAGATAGRLHGPTSCAHDVFAVHHHKKRTRRDQCRLGF